MAMGQQAGRTEVCQSRDGERPGDAMSDTDLHKIRGCQARVAHDRGLLPFAGAIRRVRRLSTAVGARRGRDTR